MYFKCNNGKLVQILSCFSASLGVFAFGIALLWPAPIIPKLLEDDSNQINKSIITISTSEASWIASVAMLVLPVAAVITMFLVEKYGSKNILLMTSVPLLLSWVLIIYTDDITYLYAARVLVGVAHAFCYGAASIYVSEVAEPGIRGILNFFLSVMLNASTLLTYCFAYSLPIDYFAKLAIISPILHFVLFIGVPQSPYYLIACNRFNDARRSLEKLRGSMYKETEFQTIRETVRKEMANKASLKSLFNNLPALKSVGLLTMMALLQQLTGTSSVTSYFHLIVQKSEIQMDLELAALIFMLMGLLANAFSIFLIDRQGRRPLTFFSLAGASVFLILEGLYFYFKENNYSNIENFAMPSFFLLLAYVFFIDCGLTFMPILLAGELFPTNVRSYGSAISLIIYGTFGTLTNKGFQIIMDAYGMSYGFFIFGGFSFLGLIATYFWLPETRNQSLAEIQLMLQSDKTKTVKHKHKNIISC